LLSHNISRADKAFQFFMKNTLKSKAHKTHIAYFTIGVVFVLAASLFVAIPAQAQYDSYDYGYDSYSYDNSYDSYSYDNYDYDSYSYDSSYDYGYANDYDSYSYDTGYDSYGYDSGYDSYSYDDYDYGYDSYTYDNYNYDYGYDDYGYSSYNYDSGCGLNCGSYYGCTSNCGGYSRPVYYTPTYTYSRPVYSYQSTPVYTPAPTPALQASCYASPTSARIGDTVQWVASASGGAGSYSYSWNGTDSLSGSGSIISRSYSSIGQKTATVVVTSGSQSITRSCSNGVNIYQDTVYYPPYIPPYNPPQYYPNLSVSCSVNTTFAPIGTSVTWTAYAFGGNGSYTYNWTGTESLYGYAQSIYRSYNNVGQKYASVTVHSDGQTITRDCSNSLTVGARTIVYAAPKHLDIGCFADPTNLKVNQPVTWSAEVTGGSAPYTYSWSGSDGLSGNQRAVTKYYGTTGNKSAVVTITSADGKTGTRACSNAAIVKSGATTVVAKKPVTQAATSTIVASPVFAFPNIPWCWIAVFVIIILFITILYLLFNKSKI